MKTKTMEWSGNALLISGLIIAAAMLFHPDDAATGSFLRPAWVPVNFVLGIAVIVALSRDPAYELLLDGTTSIMNGPLGYFIWTAMVLGSVGYLMLAAYLVSSKTIIVMNGILFIGVPLVSFAPPIPYVLEITGGVLFGLALFWLGVSVRAGKAHKVLEETLRLEDECIIAHAGVRA